MRSTLVAVALMLAMSAPVQGAQKYEWGFYESGGDSVLLYGVPETEIVIVSFICEAGRVSVTSFLSPPKRKKGQSVRLTIRNGAKSVAYDGKIRFSEDDGFDFYAPKVAGAEAMDILKSGTSVVLSVPGKQERVPLRGLAKPLAQFEKACLAGR